MPNLLVNAYRRKNPETQLSDDEITLYYANRNASNIQAFYDADPMFKSDLSRILGGSVESEEQDDSKITALDTAGHAYSKFVEGFMGSNVVTGTAETAGIGGAALNRITGLPEEGGWYGETPHDPDKTASMRFANFLKEDVTDAITPDISESKTRRLEQSTYGSDLPAALGSGAGFILGGGLLTKIFKGGLQKFATKQADEVFKETIEAGARKGVTQEVAEKAAQEAAEAAFKKSMNRSMMRMTATQGALVNGPAGYRDAIQNGATPSQAFASWLLNAGVGTTEILPINRMISRITKGTGATGIRETLINAGKEGMEEALQETLQSYLGDKIAKDIVEYDPDRKILAEWEKGAEVGGLSGALLSIASTVIGGKVRKRQLEKKGINVDAIEASERMKEVDTKIKNGEKLNEAEAEAARSVGFVVGEDGVAIEPDSTEVIADAAYSGENEAAIIALAQREAEQGFTREIEEEYNRLIGIRGTDEEDVLARKLYDKTKYEAQATLEVQKEEEEVTEFFNDLESRILNVGDPLSEEERKYVADKFDQLELDGFHKAELQAAEDRKGSPLTNLEKVGVLIRFEREAKQEADREKQKSEEQLRQEFFAEEEARVQGNALEEEINTLEAADAEAERIREEQAERIRAAEAVLSADDAARQATALKNETIAARRAKEKVTPAPAVENTTQEPVEKPTQEVEEDLQAQLDEELGQQQSTTTRTRFEGPVENLVQMQQIADQAAEYAGSATSIRVFKQRINRIAKTLEDKRLNPNGLTVYDLFNEGELERLESDIADFEATEYNKQDRKEVLEELREGSNGWQTLGSAVLGTELQNLNLKVPDESVDFGEEGGKKWDEYTKRIKGTIKAKPPEIVAEPNSETAFDAAVQSTRAKAEELVKDEGTLEEGAKLLGTIQRDADGKLNQDDVAIEPPKQAKTATGGPGFFSVQQDEQTAEGQDLKSQVEIYNTIAQVQGDSLGNLQEAGIDITGDSSATIRYYATNKAGEELSNDDYSKMSFEDVLHIAVNEVSIGSGSTVDEAVANAKVRAAERIAESMSVGYKSNLSSAATHRIGVFVSPEGKVVALGLHQTTGGKPMVPNIKSGVKAKSMPASELINTYGYKPYASIRTKKPHKGLVETYENLDEFNQNIGSAISNIQSQVSDLMVGAEATAQPSKTTTLQDSDQQKFAPRREGSPRASDAKVNTAFSNILSAARNAGVDVRVVQKEFADMEQKAAAYMTYEDGKAVAVLAMESVNNPTIGNHTDLLHEIGHASFDQIDPEVKAALLEAISKASDAALGIEGSQFIFDSSNIDQVPNELTQEERLVESIAKEMQQDGFDPEASKGLVASVVRIFKNLTFNASMAWQRLLHGPKALSPDMARQYFRLKTEAFLTNSSVPRITDYLVAKPSLLEVAAQLSSDITQVTILPSGDAQIEPLPATSVANVQFNLKHAGYKRFAPESRGEEPSRTNTTIAKRGAASNNFVLKALRNAFVAFTESGANRNVFGDQRVDEETFLSRVLNKRGPIEILEEIKLETDDSVAGTTMSDLDKLEDRPRAAQDADRFLSGLIEKLREQYNQAVESLDPRKGKSLTTKRAMLYSQLDEMRRNYDNLSYVSSKLNEGIQGVVKNYIADRNDKRNMIRQALMAVDPKFAGARIAANVFERQPTREEFDKFNAMINAGVDFTQTPAQIIAEIQHKVPSLMPDSDRESILLAKFMVMADTNPIAVSLMELRSEGEYKGLFDEVLRIALANDKTAVARAEKKLREEFPADERGKVRSGSIVRFRRKADKVLKAIRKKKAEYAELDREINQARDTIALYETTKTTLFEERAVAESMYDKEMAFQGVQWEPTDGSQYFLPTNPDQPIDEVENFTQTLNLKEKLDIPKIDKHIERMTAWLNNQPENRRGALWKTIQRQRDKLITLPADQIQRDVSTSYILNLLGDYGTKLDQIGSAQSRKIHQAFRKLSENMNSYGGEVGSRIGRDWAVAFADVASALKRNNRRSEPQDVQEIYDRAFHYFERNRDVLNENPGESGQRKLVNGLKSYLKADKDYAYIIDDIWPQFQKLILATRKASNHVNNIRRELGLSVKDEFGSYVFFRDSIGDSLTTTMRKPSGDVAMLFNAMRPIWIEQGGSKSNVVNNPSELQAMYLDGSIDSYMARLYPKAIMQDFVGPLARNIGEGMLTSLTDKGFKRPIPQSLFKEAFNNNPSDMRGMLEAIADAEGMTTPEQRAEFVADAMLSFQKVFNTIKSTQQRDSGMGAGTALPPHIMMDARKTSNWPAEWVTFATFGQRNMHQYAKHLSVESAFGRDMTLLSKDMDLLEKQIEDEIHAFEKIDKELRALGHHSGNRYSKEKYKREFKKLAAEQDLNGNILLSAKNRQQIVSKMKENITTWLRSESTSPLEYHALMDFVRTLSGFTVQSYGTALIDTISIVEQPLRKMGFGKTALKQLRTNLTNSLGIGAGSLFQLANRSIGFKAEQMQLLQEFGLDDMTATTEGNFFTRIKNNFRASMQDEFVGTNWFTRGMERVSRAGRAFLEAGGGRAQEGQAAFPAFRPLTPFTQLAKQSAMANTMSTWDQYSTLILQTAKMLDANPQYADIMRTEGVLFDEAVLKKNGLTLKKVLKDLGYGRSFLVLDDTKAFLQMNESLQRSGFTLERVTQDFLKRRSRNPKADPIGDKNLYRALANLTVTETMLETDLLTRPTAMTSSKVGQFAMPLVGWSISKTNDVVKELAEPNGVRTWRGAQLAMMSYMAIFPVQFLYAFLRDWYDEEIVGKKSDVQQGAGMLNMPSMEQIKEQPIESLQVAIERMDRVGSLGIAGEFIQAASTAGTGGRELSIDSRVYALNSARQGFNTIVRFFQQGGFDGATWQTIYRPMAQALGGSGLLQTAQAVNNVGGKILGEPPLLSGTPLEADYWVNHRIGVQNYIRAAGRQLDLDVRPRSAMRGTPSKTKAMVGQMMLYAIADDYQSFQKARRAAEEAAREDGKEDPKKSVLASFQSYHPLKMPFKTSPTEAEFQDILESLPDDAREGVRQAIDNINRYIERLGGRGYEGKKAKQRKVQRIQRRPSMPRMQRPDYRASSTAF